MSEKLYGIGLQVEEGHAFSSVLLERSLTWQHPILRETPAFSFVRFTWSSVWGGRRSGKRWWQLPGAVSANEGLKQCWGRAVPCLSHFVTVWKWPLTGHVVLPLVWCVTGVGLISQLLHPLGHKAECLWSDYHPLVCKLCWHFSLVPRACKTWILGKTHECELFKLVRVELIHLLISAEGCAGEPCVILCICGREDLKQILSGCFYPGIAISKLIYCAAMLSHKTWSCMEKTLVLLLYHWGWK